MRIFWGEFLKVFERRAFVLAFLLLLGANAVLLAASDTGALFGKEDYRDVYTAMGAMTSEEKLSYIEENYEELKLRYAQEADTDLFARYQLFESLYEEAESIRSYPAYLADIRERAQEGETISIFQTQDAFSMRNARKTAEAYEGLSAAGLELNNSGMVNQMTEFGATNILIAFLVFMICSILIIEEKEGGQFLLLRPLKHGRGRLMAGKIAALLAVTAVICTAFFAENYIVSGWQYGFARLDIPLQAIAGYSGSALHRTLGEYLLIYLFSKVIAVFILGLFFFLFSLTAKTVSLYYIKVVAFLGISYLLYAVLPGEGIFQILKYANIIPFLLVTPVYQYYFNLNIAGFPVEITVLFWAVSIVCILGLSVALVILFTNRELAGACAERSLRRGMEQKRVHTSVFYHECYKIFITNKALLLLLLFAGFQVYSMAHKSTYLPYDEYYYRQYMEALEGPLDDERIALIEQEEERFAEMDKLLEEANQKLESGEITERDLLKTRTLVQEQTKGRNAFLRVLERREYIVQYEKNHGRALDFVYEGGWEYLLGRETTPYENDMQRAIALLLVMIASFAGVFSMEYSTQMIRLLACSRRGRMHTVKAKLWICAGITTVLFLINYIPDLVNAYRIYGLHEWDSSIYSIPSLANFPIDISIRSYVVLLFTVRYLMALCTLEIIAAVSLYAKSMIGAILPLLLLLVAPLLVELLGIGFIRSFSLNRFFTGNGYLDSMQDSGWVGMTLCIPVFISLMGGGKIRREFRE